MRLRTVGTRLVVVLVFALLLFTKQYWVDHGLCKMFMETTGLVFIGTSVLGRIWASLYICGYKGGTLITEGPYSIVRNPLYFFSFIGTIGFGLSTESLLITGMLVLLFIFCYPHTVAAEEQKLLARHGDAYSEYSRTTPRFIPKPALLNEPEMYVVNIKKCHRAFLDAATLILSYGLVHILVELHKIRILPGWFTIP